ncbi:type VI secretion system protein TssA [Trinickia sp. LjRoot230]|uniref:type VI secretion system protein TssA n=1 Tax=Trinickia sp. LjRoot230 TaxID=3342288 RepID=UPI003ECD4A25
MLRSNFTDSLLAGIVPEEPCGPNLEYQADYLLLMQSAKRKPEQQYGDVVIPAQEPDWPAVERLALGLCERTKDLRVVAHLVRSWIELHGIAGYADGLRLLAGLIDSWWDDLHPRLDSDGEYDPAPRMNALAEVAGAHECARAVRYQPMLENGLSVREAERVLNGCDGEQAEYSGGLDRLKADLQRARDESEPLFLAALATLDALDAIRECVTARLGVEWIPDASEFEKTLRHIAREVLTRSAAQEAEASRATTAHASPPGDSDRGVGGGALVGITWREVELASRDDVRMALEKVCRYFEHYEPSHPAPILLRRAHRLLSLDFLEIIRDLAPESLPQIELLSGQRSG